MKKPPGRKQLAQLAGKFPTYKDLGDYLAGVLKVKVEIEEGQADTFIFITGTPWQHRRAADLMYAWKAGLQSARRHPTLYSEPGQTG